MCVNSWRVNVGISSDGQLCYGLDFGGRARGVKTLRLFTYYRAGGSHEPSNT